MRYDVVCLDIDGTLLWVDLNRRGTVEAPLATFVLPDLKGLPGIVEGKQDAKRGWRIDRLRIERAVREILLP
jgi:hypothetical protein